MRNEKDVKKKVKAILDKHQWFWCMPPANAYGKTGISDFLCWRRGAAMVIETKFGSNKPTAMQIGFLNSIRAEDGFAFVVSDRNIDWFEAFMESFDIAVVAQSKKQEVPPEHGARMLNALAELSNKLLDTAAPEDSVIEAPGGAASA